MNKNKLKITVGTVVNKDNSTLEILDRWVMLDLAVNELEMDFNKNLSTALKLDVSLSEPTIYFKNLFEVVDELIEFKKKELDNLIASKKKLKKKKSEFKKKRTKKIKKKK